MDSYESHKWPHREVQEIARNELEVAAASRPNTSMVMVVSPLWCVTHQMHSLTKLRLAMYVPEKKALTGR